MKQVRIIFATTLPPAAEGQEPLELKCNATATLDDATAAALIEAGRAEVVPAPKPPAGN